jgi:hypothetical protein
MGITLIPPALASTQMPIIQGLTSLHIQSNQHPYLYHSSAVSALNLNPVLGGWIILVNSAYRKQLLRGDSGKITQAPHLIV